jgi:hypothetical protein
MSDTSYLDDLSSYQNHSAYALKDKMFWVSNIRRVGSRNSTVLGKTEQPKRALVKSALSAQAAYVLILLVPLACVAAVAADSSSPVFIKSACDSKISAVALSSLKSEIITSQKYRLASNLSDNGQMDSVLTINMICTERNDVAGIATAFGRAKCFDTANCHLTIDGSSLSSVLAILH